jgi:hypothetical protein
VNLAALRRLNLLAEISSSFGPKESDDDEKEAEKQDLDQEDAEEQDGRWLRIRVVSVTGREHLCIRW